MRYLINNQISFDAIKGELYIYGEEAAGMCTLPDSATRLLAFLIANKENIVSREELLDEIWEQYDLKASYNNLGNYLRSIRKAFKDLGMDDEVIITFPKKGVQLNPDMVIEEVIVPEISKLAEIPEKTRLFMIKSKVFILLLSLAIIGGGYVIYKHFYGEVTLDKITKILNNNEKLKMLPSIKSCAVFTLNTVYDEKAINRKIAKKIERLQVNCDTSKTLIYYTDSPFEPPAMGTMAQSLFIVCTYGNKGEYGKCVSHYYYREIQ
ncbi:winged helix-turn-helix domain-containing protein [Serratia sp. T13T92]|uniref:winged helix-turn-helix domain-containing protein n=1 Tax=Serratia sp. T13T92 TaxID=3397496 RepID=UPI0039DF9C3C